MAGVGPGEDRVYELLGQALTPESETPPEDRVAVLRANVAGAAAPITRPPRARWALPAAGLAAAAAVVVIGLFVSRSDDEPVVPRESVEVASSVASVDAEADLIAHTWGTEINLVVTGLDVGTYDVTIDRRNGGPVLAGSFIGVADVVIKCNLNAAVLRDDATGFTVTDPNGQTVLRSELA